MNDILVKTVDRYPVNLSVQTILRFFVVLLPTLSYIFYQLPELSVVDFTFIVLLVQSVILLCFVGGRQLTLLNVYFVFSIMFFCVAPWLQYANKVVLWSPKDFSNADYIITNYIIFMSNIVVFLSYFVVFRRRWSGGLFKKLARKVDADTNQSCLLPSLLILLSVVSLYFLFYLNNFSIMSVFFKGFVEDELGPIIESSSLLMIADKLVRLIPFFSFLYSYNQTKSRPLINLILFVLLLICAFPTGISRYMVAFIYIPILLLLFPRLFRGFTFSYILIGSIIFIFPFLNQFRDISRLEKISILPSPDMFFSGHFDAYQNLMQVIQLNLVTYGNQILGVALFFVPRAVWDNKAIGSGHYLSEVGGLSFNNISMPLLGEGYINFGILGVIAFSIAAGVVMGVLDKVFDDTRFKTNSRYLYSVYLYFCGALTFVLRGDLLSSFAYVMSGIVSAVLVVFLAKMVKAVFPYSHIRLFSSNRNVFSSVRK